MLLRPIEEEIKTSYIDYAMSVIVSRAIPDFRDGLKPVQRRIIYSMYELGVTHDKPYKKSARIIGETMGKYHPHGDSSIYEALARMAQDFSLRYTLIDGQGNFGSIDGDSPAAMRYTEARLGKIAEEMIRDIEKETVDFIPNFDGSLNEPVYFPSRIPQLLINGTSGIAVGMATNMVPHNLTEISDAMLYAIDNPQCEINDLLQFVKGPDFPGGGILYRNSDLLSIYTTGHGKVFCQGEVEEEKKKIIIKTLPYGVNKAIFIQNVAEHVKNGIINNITDIRDESDRHGIRIVIKIRNEDSIGLTINQLYEHTQLESTIAVNNLVLLDNEPKVMNLKEMISGFISFRLDVIRKRSIYEVKKLMEREHILIGLTIALQNIDLVIKIIRSSDTVENAKNSLMSQLTLSERQATAILEMRLQRLTGMEIKKIEEELASIRENIKRLNDIINNEDVRKQVLKDETLEIKKQYGDERRTKVLDRDISGRNDEDIIPNEESIIVLSENGLLKRVSNEEYNVQKRGGKGIITATRKEDTVKSLLSCMSHDMIYFFTNTGRVLRTKAYTIEKKSRMSLGSIGSTFLRLNENEKIKQIMKSPTDSKSHLIIITKMGFIKKTPAREILDMRESGLKIIKLDDADEVVSVMDLEKPSKIFVAASNNKAAVFLSDEVPSTGRTSRGVKSMRLNGAEVINSFLVVDSDTVMSISENGIGKRTYITDFSIHHRGSSGNLIFRENEKTGALVTAIPVNDTQEILIVTKNNKTIRLNASEIKILSRVTSGVKLINVDEDDAVVAASVL
ncbi:MAG: DNA gyrase subunit A [Ferroplasma sp.]